ncbi:helix-turn-helix domain-containing protein [Microbacterium aurantiacum]|uniref:helix-turn-helix domain-containing protein n=1 Tax=Microbacterium aurantiacum TaxID=162393 RepID=UPI000C80FBB7|nr:helix-turn-helix domain-containing protein [Microbacterium aurantiacum]
MKIWLTLSEAADVAGRTERTIRNWVDAGVLKSPVPGRFQRDAVLAAERTMRGRVGRPRKNKDVASP